jgi:hypothetical protein
VAQERQRAHWKGDVGVRRGFRIGSRQGGRRLRAGGVQQEPAPDATQLRSLGPHAGNNNTHGMHAKQTCHAIASTKIIFFNYFPDSEGERFQPRPAQDERRRRAVSSAGGDDRLQHGVGDAAKGAGLLRGDTGARRALARRLPRAAVHHSNHGKKNNKKKKKSTAHAPMFQGRCVQASSPYLLLLLQITVLYVTGSLDSTLSSEHRREICRYLHNRQNADGGWGLHAEGESSMLSTALNYTALRLLGEGGDGGGGPGMSSSSMLIRARKWIRDRGGATMIPILGKVWLSVTTDRPPSYPLLLLHAAAAGLLDY